LQTLFFYAGPAGATWSFAPNSFSELKQIKLEGETSPKDGQASSGKSRVAPKKVSHRFQAQLETGNNFKYNKLK